MSLKIKKVNDKVEFELETQEVGDCTHDCYHYSDQSSSQEHPPVTGGPALEICICTSSVEYSAEGWSAW